MRNILYPLIFSSMLLGCGSESSSSPEPNLGYTVREDLKGTDLEKVEWYSSPISWIYEGNPLPYEKAEVRSDENFEAYRSTYYGHCEGDFYVETTEENGFTEMYVNCADDEDVHIVANSYRNDVDYKFRSYESGLNNSQGEYLDIQVRISEDEYTNGYPLAKIKALIFENRQSWREDGGAYLKEIRLECNFEIEPLQCINVINADTVNVDTELVYNLWNNFDDYRYTDQATNLINQILVDNPGLPVDRL